MAKTRVSIPTLSVAAFLLLILGGGFIWLNHFMGPVDPTDSQPVSITIGRGDTLDTVSQKLIANHLIRSPLALKLAVMRLGISQNIQAGTFALTPQMDAYTLAQAFTHGKQDVWVTIVEGLRREEIAQTLSITLTAAGIPFNQETFLSLTSNKEGYLFPDTYSFPVSATEADIVSVLESTFDKKVTNGLTSKIKQSPRDFKDVMIIASLIEREAKGDADRKIVSGILWKRLDAGWPLQVDATLQYALGYDPIKKTWWREPLAADKEVNSTYNTYQNPGLPPTPICSPSLSSIEAALSPTSSDYWYYITDTKGQMHYSQTGEEHIRNINTYLR